MSDESAMTNQGSHIGGEGSKLMRLPKKSIQSEYLISTLLAIRDMDGIIKDLKKLDDPRPEFMARQIINRVLDDEIKYQLIDKFDEEIAEIMKDNGDADLQNKKVIKLSQDMVGEVNSYLDEFFALHKGQEIGDV